MTAPTPRTPLPAALNPYPVTPQSLGGGELPGPWMIEVVGHYLYPLVGSTAAALILEAAKGLLQLTALAKSVSASGETEGEVLKP